MREVNGFLARKKTALFAFPVLALIANAVSMMGIPVPVATNTSLVSSEQNVATGTAVLLSATVTHAGAPITAGLVTFCDANAPYCEGLAAIGSAQLSSAGMATFKVVLGPGNHSIKAVFAGTHVRLPSASPATSITVSGEAPTTTVTTSSGAAGDYTLTATVGYHGLQAPGGDETVSFVDTTNAHYALGLGTITGLSAPAYSFITIPSSPVTVGTLPASVATADFNNDGIPDLAVANLVDNTVSIFAGDGHGGFTGLAGSPFAVGTGPTALAVADVNADGRPDILVANSAAASISILIANSNGGFTAGTDVPVGLGPQSITVGDYNDDGKVDAAVANVFDSMITVLTGDGSGNFTSDPSSVYAVGQNPSWIGTADFNNDGVEDLAVVDTTSNTITILQGDNYGGFSPMAGSPLSTVTYPVYAAIGDFNADGKADLAVISGTGNTVSILLNTGTGLAVSGAPYATGASPSAILVSDVNGDGKQDLIISNGKDNTATVLIGNGAGAFAPGPNSPVTNLSSPAALAAADFNGDGTPDLAITNFGGGSTSIRPLQITQSATATLSSLMIPGAATAHLVSASYPGDSLYTASTSTPISLTGSPIVTTNTLSVSPSTTVEFGRVLQLTAAISPPSAANYTATGTAKFFDGGTLIGQSSVSNGQAVLSLGPLAVTSHSLSATYLGDANFAMSNSTAMAVTVSKAGTTTTLTATSGEGAAYTFSAVVGSTTGGTPTGTVSLFDGTSLMTSRPLVGGIASYSLASLPAGAHSISATYSGDADYAGSTSNVAAPSTGDFTLSIARPSRYVLPGQSVSYEITVNPNNSNFPNSISFSASGLPAGATATFSPSSLTPGTASATTTMTVAVPAQVAGLFVFPRVSGISVALLLLPVTAALRLRRCGRKVFPLLGIGVVVLGGLAGMATLSGCGNGNGFPVQASRSYSLSVTATSGTLTHAMSVALTVE